MTTIRLKDPGEPPETAETLRGFLQAEYTFWSRARRVIRIAEAFQASSRGSRPDDEVAEVAHVAKRVSQYVFQLLSTLGENPDLDGPGLLQAAPPPSHEGETKRRLEQIAVLVRRFGTPDRS